MSKCSRSLKIPYQLNLRTMANTSRLLALSPEILQMILKLLLVLPRPIDQREMLDHTRPGELSWKVLLTCKRIYSEGRTLLYGQNISHVSGDLDELWSRLGSISEQNLASIQRFATRLCIDYDSPHWSKASRVVYNLYNPRHRLTLLRPTDLVVVNMDLSMFALRFWSISAENNSIVEPLSEEISNSDW